VIAGDLIFAMYVVIFRSLATVEAQVVLMAKAASGF